MSGETIVNKLVEDMMHHKQIQKYAVALDENTFQKGDGAQCELTFLTVTYTSNNEDQCRHLVVKTAKTDDILRRKTPVRVSYEREVLMYTKVFPAFHQLEIEKGIKSPYNGFPKCYSTTLEVKKEALLLENLKYLGYTIHDKQKPQDLNHALMVFENYGKIHGISLALRHHNPSAFHSLTKDMCDVMALVVDKSELMPTFYKNFKFAVDLFITSENDVKIEVKEKFKQFDKKELYRILTKLKEPESAQSAILHGDNNSNNAMFKYEDINDKTKPTDMKLIDFQLCTVGSPVFDLSYYLYTCADEEVLQHFDLLLQCYQASLSSTMTDLKCEEDKILTLDDVWMHWKKFGVFGMALCPFIVKMQLCEPDEVVDLAEGASDFNKAFDKDIRNQKTYEKRIKDVFRHFAKEFF